jgi:hypothetical protein
MIKIAIKKYDLFRHYYNLDFLLSSLPFLNKTLYNTIALYCSVYFNCSKHRFYNISEYNNYETATKYDRCIRKLHIK